MDNAALVVRFHHWRIGLSNDFALLLTVNFVDKVESCILVANYKSNFAYSIYN